MTAEQIRTTLRGLVPKVEAADTSEAENTLARHLRELQAFAYRTTHVAHKVGRHLDEAACLLEVAGDGPEAAKHLRTALAALEPRRAPRRAA